MTTTRARATTTEPGADSLPARRRAVGVSVRVRITATIAALVLLTLTGAGLIVYLIESERIEQQTADAVDQEISEFETLQHNGLDRDTGRPFRSVGQMLELFMLRNVPDDDETLVGFVGPEPRHWFVYDTIREDPAFLNATRPLLSEGGTTRTDSGQGELMITVQPIQQGEQRGALVVVSYLDGDRAELLDTMRTYTIVAGLSLLLVTAAAFWQSGRLLAPLRTLRLTAEEISETDLSRRLPVTGNDDITDLTRTVNGMLARLESAFSGQRQFLDDAGHELRTPLTILRGHLDVLDTDNPDDVAETRQLLLEEVDRMSRLVNDLILLAKSDRPDFLRPTTVDLAGLTEDLLAKARGLGERRWTLDSVATGTVQADPQRLTQALLQLCDNAVKHTTPADAIAIGSSHDAAGARLWVRDTGPGIPAEDREAVFERFGRGRVPERDEGFGLGLSIVRAIARAHGGDVAVDDTWTDGAKVVVTLPPGDRTGDAHSPQEDTLLLETVTWPAS